MFACTTGKKSEMKSGGWWPLGGFRTSDGFAGPALLCGSSKGYGIGLVLQGSGAPSFKGKIRGGKGVTHGRLGDLLDA